jgi:predicted nucleic acid-binding protein
MDGLQHLPTAEDTWDDAAVLGMRMRRAGLVTQSSDLLIAAVGLRAGATILHRDRDFDLIAKHAPLKVESHLP